MEQSEIEDYNYAVFEGREDFLAFRGGLQVGMAAPDFAATLLATGETVRLSDFWRQQDVVIEFGAHT